MRTFSRLVGFVRQPYAALSALTAILGSVVFFSLPPALATATDSCPNAEFRTGPSAHLPDCRAYEMVSPLDKGGSDVTFGAFGGPDNPANPVQIWQAATGGDSVEYASRGAFAATPSSLPLNAYLAERGPAGWFTRGIGAPMNASDVNSVQLLGNDKYVAFSPDLSVGVLTDLDPNGPLLAPGAVLGYPNLYLRDNGTDAYTGLTTVAPPNFPPQLTIVSYLPVYQGASADFSHVIFTAPDALTPDAPNPCSSCLYEWAGGQLRLVNLLPDATPTAQADAGGPGGIGGRNLVHAVSADGSKVYWTDATGTSTGNIYVRVNPDKLPSTLQGTACSQQYEQACTVPVGTGRFWAASADGEHALYTSDPGTGDGDHLFEFDLSTGQSTDLTPGGGVDGVVGESTDLSYIYYDVVAGPSLYLWHAGATTFITNPGASGTGQGIDSPDPTQRGAYVTPDGRHLAFMSNASLTGYDNAPVDPGACAYLNNRSPEPCPEVFYYDAGTGALSCASCNPSGAPPRGASTISVWEDGFHQPRDVNDNGSRVFFESGDALVPGDTNGQQDVYEWQPDGSGGCRHAAGCVGLISGGTGGASDPTAYLAPLNDFVDASASGDDVFFTTQQPLVPADTDGASDLYDARVGGGLASQHQLPSTPCTGDACKGQLGSTPSVPTAASVSFSGPGNPAPAAARAKVTSAKVTMLSRTVRGTSFVVRVRVPAKGRITITGADIKTVRKSVAMGGTYRLRIRLTARGKRLLRRHHRVKLRLRVAYAPAAGSASIARVTLTVKPAIHHNARRAGTRRGGAK